MLFAPFADSGYNIIIFIDSYRLIKNYNRLHSLTSFVNFSPKRRMIGFKQALRRLTKMEMGRLQKKSFSMVSARSTVI